MTDRELLELAAKAARESHLIPYKDEWLTSVEAWNPLRFNADAFRLAVQLNMDLMGQARLHDGTLCRSVIFPLNGDFEALSEPENGDPYVATRRAIVRAAAEVGKAM